MSENPAYTIEHCRNRCIRAARPLEPLVTQLKSALDKLDFLDIHNEKFSRLNGQRKVKIGISGCPNGCSQHLIKDIGIAGYVKPKLTGIICRNCQSCVMTCREKAVKVMNGNISFDSSRCLSCGDCLRNCLSGAIDSGERGWKLYFGGRVGRHPHFAELVGTTTDNEELIEWVIEALKAYAHSSSPNERLSRFLERYKFDYSFSE